MVQFTINYEGDLHCSLTHGPSGAVITTDAPIDNHGRGEAFSPTDLCSASLGACMATVMGIEAQKHKVELSGMRITVEKYMVADPLRRIGTLNVSIYMPPINDEKIKTILKNTANTCPVKRSLSSDIEINIEWHWA